MQELSEEYKKTRNAVKNFEKTLTIFREEAQNERLYRYLRDSCLKGFELSMETLWKFLRHYGREKFGADFFDVASPRKVFLEFERLGIITQEELKLLTKIVEDRSLSMRSYEEGVAEELLERLDGHYKIMQSIVDRCGV